MTTKKTKNSYKKIPVAAASVILSVAVCHTPWLKTAESVMSDSLYLLRGEIRQPEEIVIVAIDESSFAALGMQWPWPRKIHAELLENLYRAGAAAVAFDVIFGEASSPEDDNALKDAVKNHPETVLASNIQTIISRGYTQQVITDPNQAISDDDTRKGLANLPLDNDGFIRRLSCGDSGMNSIAIEVSDAFCTGTGCRISSDLTESDFPGNAEINFAGPAGSIKTVSYYQALEPEKYLPKDFFRKKLVITGFATGVNTVGKDKGQDSYPVPFTRLNGGYMSGAEIHANAAASIIKESWIKKASPEIMSIAGIITGALSGSVLFLLGPVPSFIFILSGIIASLSAAFMLFTGKNINIPLTFIVLPQISSYVADLAFDYWHTHKEKKIITSAFSTYLSPALLDRLVRHPESLKPGGESVEATVMFIDFADFTSLSEKTPPDRLLELLNSYLEIFTDIIFKWDGMIDKFIGDAVMAVWGVPVKTTDHAVKACRAAIEISEAVKKKNRNEESCKNRNEPEIRIRIGINTGLMTAGNVGGIRHFNYTVIGDSVNTASRLEGINKVYGTTIIAGQNTVEQTGGIFPTRLLDFVKVKGKEIPMEIYELKTSGREQSENEKNAEALFQQARKLYSQRKWDDATAILRKASAINPDDMVYSVYLKRCEKFRVKPPHDRWEGAVALEK